MKMVQIIFVLLASFFMLFTGCEDAKPNLTVKSEILLGESPEVLIRGLHPGEEYVLSVEMIDAFLRDWQFEAMFYADDAGRIDLSHDTPASEIYKGPESFGAISLMTTSKSPEKNWKPPVPRDFNKILFKLFHKEVVVTTGETRQWIFPPDIKKDSIGGALVAEIFYPAGNPKLPGILLLGGSGGGMGWAKRSAALLAKKGFAAMAVAYFNSGMLPSHLVEIPVEYIELAIDTLKSRREVDPTRIALVGYSKGAEFALLVASRRPDVASVVGIAPGSAVFQGFRPPDYPVISSWSADGIGLPFVPNAYDKKFFKTFDGMYLWYRTLSQHDYFEAAAIPVEKINGDILLISGVEDQIWPATFMAEQIVARLSIKGFSHGVRHLAFPNAGHGIAAPPGEPLTSVAKRLGGTAIGNMRARSQGWQALVEFLTITLAE